MGISNGMAGAMNLIFKMPLAPAVQVQGQIVIVSSLRDRVLVLDHEAHICQNLVPIALNAMPWAYAQSAATPRAHMGHVNRGHVRLQPSFTYTNSLIDALENGLSKDRLSTYMHHAGGDREAALRIYLLNTALSGTLYGPTQALACYATGCMTHSAQSMTPIGITRWP
jgi:hypothetical protein